MASTQRKKLEQFLTQGTELEPDLRQYLEERNRKHWLLVNIESQPAIDQLDAILDVPGLDGILIGPHDLSCSLGIPEQYEDPRVRTSRQTHHQQGPQAEHDCRESFL